ncbi:hypothetical protein HPB50_018495 [Hyalomma asiaticum]|uniref:Uncharacterized protein n=1 Tax=Hyalomma asiaticum TaxID=266040 RepID=A0ACB7SZH1_HYAAI|nr:hypothetical protein HPB50_018495 [Hyalomma asiaticum]
MGIGASTPRKDPPRSNMVRLHTVDNAKLPMPEQPELERRFTKVLMETRASSKKKYKNKKIVSEPVIRTAVAVELDGRCNGGAMSASSVTCTYTRLPPFAADGAVAAAPFGEEAFFFEEGPRLGEMFGRCCGSSPPLMPIWTSSAIHFPAKRTRANASAPDRSASSRTVWEGAVKMGIQIRFKSHFTCADTTQLAADSSC